jgi:hypothetical protein
MKTRKTRFSNLALNAAIAGIMAGTLAVGGCSDSKSGAQKTEGNGCGGPNGCGGEKKTDTKGDKNACNGPNGCGGEKKGEKNSCGGHNGCGGEKKK